MHWTKRFCYISIKSVFVARNVETPNKNVLIYFQNEYLCCCNVMKQYIKRKWEDMFNRNFKFSFKHNSILFFLLLCRLKYCTVYDLYVSEVLCLKISCSRLLSMITLRCTGFTVLIILFIEKVNIKTLKNRNESRILINILIHIEINVIFSKIPFHSFLIFLYYIILLFIDHLK